MAVKEDLKALCTTRLPQIEALLTFVAVAVDSFLTGKLHCANGYIFIQHGKCFGFFLDPTSIYVTWSRGAF